MRRLWQEAAVPSVRDAPPRYHRGSCRPQSVVERSSARRCPSSRLRSRGACPPRRQSTSRSVTQCNWMDTEEGEAPAITVLCTDVANNTYTVTATPTDTVQALEDKLAQVSGIAKAESRLVYGDLKLHNDSVTLQSLGIVIGEVRLGKVPQDVAEGARLRREARITTLQELIHKAMADAAEELGKLPSRMMLCTADYEAVQPLPVLRGLRDKGMRHFFARLVGDVVELRWSKRADGTNGLLSCASSPPKRRTVTRAGHDGYWLAVSTPPPHDGCIHIRSTSSRDVASWSRALDMALAATQLSAMSEAETEALVADHGVEAFKRAHAQALRQVKEGRPTARPMPRPVPRPVSEMTQEERRKQLEARLQMVREALDENP